MKYSSYVILAALNLLCPTVESKRQFSNPAFLVLRGGQATDLNSSTTSSTVADNDSAKQDGEMSLEEKVHAAMRKLGISPPGDAGETSTDSAAPSNVECKDGICEIKKEDDETVENTLENYNEIRDRLASELSMSESIVQAAIGATIVGDASFPSKQRLNERAARELLQYELDAIQKVTEDCDEVTQLTSEGFDKSLARRALAFADMNVDTARAILIADEEDAKEEENEMARIEAEREEEEKRAQLRAEANAKEQALEMKTVSVDANFDPTKIATGGAKQSSAPKGAPSPAKKEDVVFEATAANIQKIILESPVPVILDVYADWCGPCKALAPILEEMAIKGGGMFRLVKLNTDEERTISSALEVTSLPTIFGIRNGKIVNSFKGMPRDQKFMADFMMGLFGAAEFKPKPSKEEVAKYDELSNKLIKIAGASGFSFSQRERLQVRTNNMLDEIAKSSGGMVAAEESAKVLRSLLSNVIRDPFELKFRQVNLENKIIQAKVGSFPSALSILRSVGFEGNDSALYLGKGKSVVNVAPLVVARDTIDKWIDLNRRAIAAAARKKEDDLAREKMLTEAEEVDDVEEDDEEPEIDPNVCTLNLRIQGKKKMHKLSLNADDSLSSILDNLPITVPDGEDVIITCTARRLIVKSTDVDQMRKSLRECKLHPSASIVVQVGSETKESDKTTSSSLQERAAARKAKKKGEHTMQSIGIYSKDDNAKGELIDGGGGVWYEQDVTTDDEQEHEDILTEPHDEETKDSTEEDNTSNQED